MDRPLTVVAIAVAAVAQVIEANLWVPTSAGSTAWQHLMFHRPAESSGAQAVCCDD